MLLDRSGTADIIGAHVAELARRLRATVVTSDPDDLSAIAPDLVVA